MFLEHPLLRDEVEEVLAGVGPLHDDDEAVHPLEVIHQPHHAWAGAQQVKQTHLQGNFVISNLSEINIYYLLGNWRTVGLVYITILIFALIGNGKGKKSFENKLLCADK